MRKNDRVRALVHRQAQGEGGARYSESVMVNRNLHPSLSALHMALADRGGFTGALSATNCHYFFTAGVDPRSEASPPREKQVSNFKDPSVASRNGQLL